MINTLDGFPEGEILDGFNTLPRGTTLDLFYTIDEIKALVARKSLLLLRRRDAKSDIFGENANIADCLGCGPNPEDCVSCPVETAGNNSQIGCGLSPIPNVSEDFE